MTMLLWCWRVSSPTIETVTALLEMAGAIQGAVNAYLHNWFIWLPPAGFSEPPNYYYQENCINYYMPKWVCRQAHPLGMGKQILKGRSLLLPFLRLTFIFKDIIKTSPYHPMPGGSDKAPGSSLPVFSLFHSFNQITQKPANCALAGVTLQPCHSCLPSSSKLNNPLQSPLGWKIASGFPLPHCPKRRKSSLMPLSHCTAYSW